MPQKNLMILDALKSALTDLQGVELLNAVLLLERELNDSVDEKVYQLISVLADELSEAIVYESDVLNETDLTAKALQEANKLSCDMLKS